jgi:hypothetical protein
MLFCTVHLASWMYTGIFLLHTVGRFMSKILQTGLGNACRETIISGWRNFPLPLLWSVCLTGYRINVKKIIIKALLRNVLFPLEISRLFKI